MHPIELTPTRMAYGGSAVARHDRQVVFVPYALPEERVMVTIPPDPKRWVQGQLVHIVEPSASRVTPPCPHFGMGKCGGCQWQHADYPAQLQYKTEVVRDQLQRIGGIESPPVLPTLGMAEPWHYRNHIQLRVGADGLGFVSEDHAGVYPINSCEIANHAITPLLPILAGAPLKGISRLALRGSTRTGERMVIIEGEGAERLVALVPEDCAIVRRDRKGNAHALRGSLFLHEEAAGRRWQIHANAFFQVNTVQAEELLKVVKGFLGGLKGNEGVVDGYAGAGFFGLSLAENVGQVWLIESHPAAVESAHFHARATPNATILHGKTETVLSEWGNRPAPDVVVLDPPRAGCAPAVLESLGKAQVPTIIYVSCDPSTQARDIRRLGDFGYLLDVVQPVDLFPHSYHIETVARLVLSR
jgi:23S rRNA (uracil1939-C5)-methyltransferase